VRIDRRTACLLRGSVEIDTTVAHQGRCTTEPLRRAAEAAEADYG
jgi:hypothetical protein